MLPAIHVNTDAVVNKNTNMYLQEITQFVRVIFLLKYRCRIKTQHVLYDTHFHS